MKAWMALVGLLFAASPALPQPWVQVPYDPANFSASGAMLWQVTENSVRTFRYKMLDPNTMALLFVFEETSVDGTPDQELRLRIPGGYSSAAEIWNTMVYFDRWSGVGYSQQSIGTISTRAAGETHFKLRKSDNTNWTRSNRKTYMFGQIILEVQDKR